jgi:hypothetical protein
MVLLSLNWQIYVFLDIADRRAAQAKAEADCMLLSDPSMEK